MHPRGGGHALISDIAAGIWLSDAVDRPACRGGCSVDTRVPLFNRGGEPCGLRKASRNRCWNTDGRPLHVGLIWPVSHGACAGVTRACHHSVLLSINGDLADSLGDPCCCDLLGEFGDKLRDTCGEFGDKLRDPCPGPRGDT